MLRLDLNDTIAAIATPPGPGLRGLIRLTGPQAIAVASCGFQANGDAQVPRTSRRIGGALSISGWTAPLDASILFWPGTRTYTGQPMAEVQVIGSPPVLRDVLSHYLAHGARLAEPGEFTLRAFLSGRIDLTQSEAVLGVIDARTPDQLDAALAQLAGGMSEPIGALRDHLLEHLAHLEANLDFSEEPDVDVLSREHLAQMLDSAAREIESLALRLNARDLADDRPRVVLVGLPNAGKSTLFNALAGADRAIVSPIAGTTRDYLTAVCDCDGLTVELVDTAGVDELATGIDAAAQLHRVQQSQRADLVLHCVAADSGAWTEPEGSAPFLHVQTKADLSTSLSAHALPTSAEKGEGLPELKRAIARLLRSKASESNALASTTARCRDSLDRAGTSLRTAAETIRFGGGDELVAVDLRQAIDDLGRVVGAIVTDDILNRIFQRFCIGK